MGRKFNFNDLEDDDFNDPEPTPVPDLPYYNTLRTILEPYLPAADILSAHKTFASAEIIKAIEEHHGVPQGPVCKGDVMSWVAPEDFVRAMEYLGFRCQNVGGLGLVWLMKKK